MSLVSGPLITDVTQKSILRSLPVCNETLDSRTCSVWVPHPLSDTAEVSFCVVGFRACNSHPMEEIRRKIWWNRPPRRIMSTWQIASVTDAARIW